MALLIGILADRLGRISAVYTGRPGRNENVEATLILWRGDVLGSGLILGIYRMILARYSHYYRLTTRRLFVSTGFVHRRRDQMELLRVKDVFTRQLTLLPTGSWAWGPWSSSPTDKDMPTSPARRGRRSQEGHGPDLAPRPRRA